MEKVLFFDGICVMCSGLVSFVLNHDRHKRFKFATLQGKAALEKIPQFTKRPLKTVVLLDGEEVYTESDAILQVLVGLGGFFRLIAVLKIVPKFIRDPIYRFIAQNRYRWFGQTEHCALLTKEQRAQIID